ncbi:MAG: hypothetical protein R3B48_23435, partial [Kofleriaceae bacterium]
MSDEADAPCDRFARAGALDVERGVLDAEHLASCADCRDAHAAYLRLAALLRDTRPDVAPSSGWEERVRQLLASRAAASSAHVATSAPPAHAEADALVDPPAATRGLPP